MSVSKSLLQVVGRPSRHELPPLGLPVRHVAFVDPSGGSQDSMTLAIAHGERRGKEWIAVLDCVREVRAPFQPDAVVADFAALLKSYKVTTVQADKYAGAWVVESFGKCGITCEQSAEPKSVLYGNVLPLLNSRRVELLDLRRLAVQLLGLERRTSRGGRDSIDHAPRSHDDLANAAAGALLLASEGPSDALPAVTHTPSALREFARQDPALRETEADAGRTGSYGTDWYLRELLRRQRDPEDG